MISIADIKNGLCIKFNHDIYKSYFSQY